METVFQAICWLLVDVSIVLQLIHVEDRGWGGLAARLHTHLLNIVADLATISPVRYAKF